MKRIGIVGGGIGGLFTAYLIQARSARKFPVTVFEATNRLGGKIITGQFSRAPVRYEAGAAELYCYAVIARDPLYELVRDLRLPTVELSGQTIVMGDRIMRTRRDVRRHMGEKALREIEKFQARGRSLFSPRQYYDSGWPDDNKHPLIGRSFESVLGEIRGHSARRYVRISVQSDLATEPNQTSGLFGVQNALLDDDRYVRLYSIQGGLERLPQTLQQRIAARFLLGCQVVRVRLSGSNQYDVCFRDGGQIRSEAFDILVVALPISWFPTIEWVGRRLERAIFAHHAHYFNPAHYLRITLLFQQPFWRHVITDSYFQLDAFGGCCVYDEGAKQQAEPYGVLSWLLAGSGALLNGNLSDSQLMRRALESLPTILAADSAPLLEGRVNRWMGAVVAHRPGYLIKGPKMRHRPEPEQHRGLIVVGDYLFDSTINGALESAEIAADLALRQLGMSTARKNSDSICDQNKEEIRIKKAFFKYYDGRKSYRKSFKEYFDESCIIEQIDAVWQKSPPYRLLDAGSASGLTLKAFAKVGIDAWGIENNRLIYQETPRSLKHRNTLGDVRNIPFDDNYFDFVYETCLCYVSQIDIEKAIQELHRVTRFGVVFGSLVRDLSRHCTKKNDLFYNVQCLWSLREWSERFLCNGFQLATDDPHVLAKVWKLDSKHNDGEAWYPTSAVMKYCFYRPAGKLVEADRARKADRA